MKRLGVLFAAVALAAPLAAAGSWEEVGKTFGQEGKALPGDVFKYSWPRSDLSVRVATVRIEPGLALGSWAAFHAEGEKAMTMGDLVLLETEVNPVVSELQAGGFEVLAIHNHLLGETPHVLYVHFMGRGEPAALARTLKKALAKTKTPPVGRPPARPIDAAAKKRLEEFQAALGRQGTMAGSVLQIGVPRAEAITDGGMPIPPSMGMAESINAQAAGERVAATGDFVLVADEVNPVIHELQAHGIEVTALHSHMLRETPRLFFMHFWGVGTPARIGEGLKAALAKVATKP